MSNFQLIDFGSELTVRPRGRGPVKLPLKLPVIWTPITPEIENIH